MSIKLALRNFPRYFGLYLYGFLLSALTEVEVTTLVILGILVGGLTSVGWGFVVVLTSWLLLRAIGGVSQIGAAIKYQADRQSQFGTYILTAIRERNDRDDRQTTSSQESAAQG